MFLGEESQEIVHFIITNWFDWSGVRIWNIFRVRLEWKLWRVNLNITITNGTLINPPRDSWNQRDDFGRICTGFEVCCWGWLLQFLGGSVDSSPWRALDWFIFLLIFGGRKLGPQILQSSDLCTILTQHSKIVLYHVWRAEINGWIVYVQLLVEDPEQKLWEHCNGLANVVGSKITSR